MEKTKDKDKGSRPKKHQEKEALLVELLEQRISEFAKRIRSGDGKDLYSTLIMEIERPLIRIILKETRGNQAKAAQILGMNRNTLRKKIKELKISLK